MKLHLDTHARRNIFTAHGAEYVAVGSNRYDHPIVVTAEQVFTDWRPEGVNALTEAHFAYFLALKPEVPLFGTGSQQHFPHPRLYQMLVAAGVGVEFMNTDPAREVRGRLRAKANGRTHQGSRKAQGSLSLERAASMTPEEFASLSDEEVKKLEAQMDL